MNFNPLDHIIHLEKPLRTAPSSWKTHVPFAMYIIAIHKPSILVELGSHNGISYCAFCQTILKLGLETKAFAIDSWEGDVHVGAYGEEILNDLRQYHDPLYGDFSILIQDYFENALERFEDHSIDLLHIDGEHTYEAVKQDFTNWLPKVSDRGIILFHDTMEVKENFGVWMLWNEIKGSYPNFEFEHGHGLGVLAVGENISEEVMAIFNMNKEDFLKFKKYFKLLGGKTEAEMNLLELSDQTS